MMTEKLITENYPHPYPEPFETSPTTSSTLTLTNNYSYPKDEEDTTEHPFETDDKPSVSDNNVISDYPEGGFGWLVVLAFFVANFWVMGSLITFGVYQAHFLDANTFPGATATELSWVGSLSTSFMLGSGPFLGIFTHIFGFKRTVGAGILISTFGMVSASFATKLWQLYLTHGVLFGTGAGFVFSGSMTIVAQYFEKKRGFAYGIGASGAGVGGLCLAQLIRYIIANLGYQWSQRIIGIVLFVSLSSVFPFIRPRIATVQKGVLFDFALLKDPWFVLALFVSILTTFGYLAPVYLMPSYAMDVLHQNHASGANLVSIFSAVNSFSRIALGISADRLGRTNTLTFVCFFCGIACLLIWTQSHNMAIFTAFAAFYGLVAGVYHTLLTVVIAKIVGVSRFQSAIGFFNFSTVFGNLFGFPIATAIIKHQNGQYIGAMIFCGVMPILASILSLIIRFHFNKKIFAIA